MMEEKTNLYQIRDALEEFEASPYLLTKNTKIREYWLTSELFQVLRICFSNRNYTVHVEDVGGSSIEVRPDIIVEGKGRTTQLKLNDSKRTPTLIDCSDR